jgi:hypothetical protein
MSENDRTGYGESPDTADAGSTENLVDGTPGNDRTDGGEQDTVLVTDDAAQRDDDVARPGNAAS